MRKLYPELSQQYVKALEKKKKINDISRVFKDFLETMETEIKSQDKKSSLCCCFSSRNPKSSNLHFAKAFKNLNHNEKLQYYINSINYAQQQQENLKLLNKKKQTLQQPQQQSERFILIKEGFSSQQITVRLLRYKLEIKDGISMDLRNYILRSSSNKRNCYILQSINKVDPKQFRFRFENDMDHDQFMPKIQKVLKLAHQSFIKRMAFITKNQDAKRTQAIYKQLLPQLVHHTKSINQHLEQNSNKAIQSLIAVANKKISPMKQQQSSNKQPQATSLKNIQEGLFKFSQDLIHQKQAKKIKQKQALQKPQKLDIKKQKPKIKHRNLFFRLYPQRHISQIINLTGFRREYAGNIDDFKIFIQNIHIQTVKVIPSFKMHMKSNLSIQIIMKSIINFQKYKEWHSQIKDASIQMHLQSQNSLVVEMIHHSRITKKNTLFTFLVYCFYLDGAYYIVQKQVKQESQFVHHKNQNLGRLQYGFWKIKEDQSGWKTIFYQCHLKHPKIKNIKEQIQIVKSYLLGFENLSTFFNNKINNSSLIDFLTLKWFVKDQGQLSDILQESKASQIDSLQFGDCQNISPFKRASSMFKTVNYQGQDYDSQQQSSQPQIIIQNVEEFSKVINSKQLQNLDLQQAQSQQNNIKETQDIAPLKNIKKQSKESIIKKLQSKGSSQLSASLVQPRFRRKTLYTSQMFIQHEKHFKQFTVELDQKGYCILPPRYIKHHYLLNPRGSAVYPRILSNGYNQIMRSDFQHDKNGVMILINKRKQDAMNGVVSQITKRMKNNLFSGKSIINVSLPVTIFKDDSNIQRMLKSWVMAPYFIQQATKIQNKVQRMKNAVAFVVSTSAYYFDIQKVFNPILGQTYQGFVAGCPLYGQQISHHPPILAMLLYGRGFKIYGSVQAKVQVRLNSAAGLNDGVLNILFDDGQKISFRNPRGQVSGLMMGKKSFRFIGTTYTYDLQNRVIAQLNFQDQSGFFSKKKWAKQTQLQGRIMIATQSFIDKFIEADYNIKPQKNDIQRVVHIISGDWTGDLKFNDYTFYSFSDEQPFKIIQQPYPLHSHANFRQDIIYRKMNDYQRSQIEKERLQQFQRSDRKLRQKLSQKKANK